MNPDNASFDPRRIRETILDMAFAGSTVHIGCAFSIVEMLTVLYRNHLRYPDNDPLGAARDYLVLSKGHGVMAQYACMHQLGWISDEEIVNYFADGTRLKGLSDSRVPGLEVTSGSLGHGFSVGVGLAKAAKLRATSQKVYAIVGDGELNEGAIWEGALFAAHHRLDNFMVLVDQNGFQAMGPTDDVLALGDLAAKFTAFGFTVQTVDGHDEVALDAAIHDLWKAGTQAPVALIARTTKGRGVDFMEHDNSWHYTRLTTASRDQAIAALNAPS